LGQADRGRSFERGKQLFHALSCAGCHRLGDAQGAVGPDLTKLQERLAVRKATRADLLRDLIEPSRVVDEKYRTLLVQTSDGRQLAGVVVGQDARVLRLAANPAQPNEVTEIPLSDIEASQPSPVSMMPLGLLDTLAKEEILDLLAYVESQADPRAAAFSQDETERE
jgi:putative heme-binding domain-containing protein